METSSLFPAPWAEVGNRFASPKRAASSAITMRKRNASSYALQGDDGGINGENVFLYSVNANDQDQQWEEIDRGGGYFTYTKAGTNFSLDGGRGGSDGQNVYLWTTSSGNYNQHWKKVSISGNIYLLQKRNASGFAIDGGRRGSNNQNVYMWNENTSNQNQQWIID